MFRMTDEPPRAATFDELALPLFEPLYHYARWLTRDAVEAEDLVQETYLKAMRGFPSFAAGTNFRAWMYRILRNTFLTSRSGLRAVPPLSIEEDRETYEELASADGTPESELLARADSAALREAIEALPLLHREVLLLADVENLSYRDIAAALDVPIGTVTSRLVRARGKVRESLRGRR